MSIYHAFGWNKENGATTWGMEGYERVWRGMKGYGDIWNGYGEIWKKRYGGIWRAMKQVWRRMEGYETGMEERGQIECVKLPKLEGSCCAASLHSFVLEDSSRLAVAWRFGKTWSRVSQILLKNLFLSANQANTHKTFFTYMYLMDNYTSVINGHLENVYLMVSL